MLPLLPINHWFIIKRNDLDHHMMNIGVWIKQVIQSYIKEENELEKDPIYGEEGSRI